MSLNQQLMNMALMIAIALGAAAPTQAGGYQLAPVSEVKVFDGAVHLKFELPCSTVDFESFVLGYDDSGDREVSVGVVFACNPGPVREFNRTLTSRSGEYEQFVDYARAGSTFVPMRVHQ